MATHPIRTALLIDVDETLATDQAKLAALQTVAARFSAAGLIAAWSLPRSAVGRLAKDLTATGQEVAADVGLSLVAEPRMVAVVVPSNDHNRRGWFGLRLSSASRPSLAERLPCGRWQVRGLRIAAEQSPRAVYRAINRVGAATDDRLLLIDAANLVEHVGQHDDSLPSLFCEHRSSAAGLAWIAPSKLVERLQRRFVGRPSGSILRRAA